MYRVYWHPGGRVSVSHHQLYRPFPANQGGIRRSRNTRVQRGHKVSAWTAWEATLSAARVPRVYVALRWKAISRMMSRGSWGWVMLVRCGVWDGDVRLVPGTLAPGTPGRLWCEFGESWWVSVYVDHVHHVDRSHRYICPPTNSPTNSRPPCLTPFVRGLPVAK